jgi:hypothetical protein
LKGWDEMSEDFILSTGDFQCPDSGRGCIFNWNVDKGIMWAEPCETGIWADCEIDEDTKDWCKRFGKKPAEDAKEANQYIRLALGHYEAQSLYFDEDE